MDIRKLLETARALVADDKGLLAMDESNPTCNKRFASLDIPQTAEARRTYREMIVFTPGLGKSISGAILYDETIRQKTSNGTPFADALIKVGIIPGIKVDTGAKPMAGFQGEKITEGLDGLAVRVEEYLRIGARFAKWRAVIAIALARYAAICQEGGLVPIVEPEVLMEGTHDLQRCLEVTEKLLHTVFNQLYSQRITLEGMILKPNMILPGKGCPRDGSAGQDDVDQVADATVHCLLRSVPASVAGVAFLSGGQSGKLATARLNAMNVRFTQKLPWPITFSFARAIQHPAIDIWSGHPANVKLAQQALLHRAECNRDARSSKYIAESEAA
jgi:fructose-bisphosphate aldolase class I